MLLHPQIGSADPRHRNVQNVISDKVDLFRRPTFQPIIDVDAPDDRVWTASVTNQNYTIHLRLGSKATALEDRLNRSYLPLKLNDPRCPHLAPDKYSSWRKLRYGHHYLRVPEARRSLSNNLFTQFVRSQASSAQRAHPVQTDLAIWTYRNGCFGILLRMERKANGDQVIGHHFVGLLIRLL